MTTTNKGLTEPANGTLNWDTPLNANFEIVDKAFGGTVTKNVTGLSGTITLAEADYQNLVVAFTGTLSANLIYQVPAGVGGQWILSNAATGAFTITFGVASGTGVVVAASSRSTVYSDGTNVYAANSASIPGSNTQVIYNSSGSLTGSNSLKFNGTALLTNAIIDAAGGNTATINGATPVGTDTAQTLTNKTLTSPTITGATITGSTVSGGTIVQGTAVASTSGAAIDFTGIPSWAKRITVMFSGVSLSGTEYLLVQLGTSGGVVSTGYLSTIQYGSAGSLSSSTGFLSGGNSASFVMSGSMVIVQMASSGIWTETNIVKLNTGNIAWGGGDVTISGTVDRVRITNTASNTFDAGTINIMYEG